MKMIVSISWKNVWRNRIRSSVVIAAFTIGIFGGVFSVATMIGMADQRIENAVKNESSHIQIHHPDFPDNNELKYTIDNYSVLADSLREQPHVAAVSPRVKIMGMASTSGNATGVMINGIIPENERLVGGIDESIIEGAGSFFEEDGRKQVVVGEKLAEVLKLTYYELSENDLSDLKNNKKAGDIASDLYGLADRHFRSENSFEQALEEHLGVSAAKKYGLVIKEQAIKYKMRNKIVLSFQALDGHIAYDAFRVAGIYETANSVFDGLNIYVIKEHITKTATMPDNRVNEIAIRLDDGELAEQMAERINEMNPQYLAEPWQDILPEARMFTEMMDFFLLVFMIIILLALGFGIVNTMLMAVLERIKELGMLMAIGMNKTRVFLMIMLETVFLGLTGSVAGLLISYLLILYTGKTGINLTHLYQEGFEAMGIDPLLYPALGFEGYVQVIVLVVLTGMIASIYPARKAIKLNPAEAIRIDM